MDWPTSCILTSRLVAVTMISSSPVVSWASATGVVSPVLTTAAAKA